ncbi:MAG: PASTA domain-containing protein [Acholeplasmatales bacterium]|nr:PASTA domain-containing protein [Acholeplasmatales bacterium]
MKLVKFIWIITGIIFLFWIYYLYISPIMFKPKQIEIPNIENISEDEAISILKKNKLSYNIHYIEGEDEKVKYTIPSIGMNVYEGSDIDVYISSILPSYYPNFEGLLFDENKELIDTFIKDNNINYNIEYIVDENGIDNQIIYQSKSNKDLVVEGDIVLFKIVKTNAYFNMPNLVGLNIYDAVELLSEYNFNLTIIYYNAPIIEDIILSQEINPGVVLKKNKEHILHLYVSKGMSGDISSVNILDFCNILNDLNYNYDIIYVDYLKEDILIDVKYLINEDKYILYITR